MEPNFPYELLRATGKTQALQVPYRVRQSRCEVKIKCDVLANVCNAIENALSKKSIFVTDDNDLAPTLNMEISTSPRGKTGRLSSYDVSVSVKGKNVNFWSSAKGVGKSELDAIISAIKKTDFSGLQKQLLPVCK